MDYICVVFSFIVLIYKCNADRIRTKENHHNVFISSSNEKEKLVNYIVEINKPLELRFQNIPISSGSCDDFYDRVPKLEATISNSTLYVTNVTYSMSNRWKCKLTMSNVTNQPTYYLYMDLHVKGAKSVKVTVNDKELSFRKANISVPYDGDAVYLYEDDECVHIVCRNSYRTGTVQLKNSAEDWSSRSRNATFDTPILLASDHAYVDCVYVTTEPHDRYVYRVHFIPKKLTYTDESTTSSNDVDVNQKVSSLALGCSIGVVLVGLAAAGAACYCRRTRTRENNVIPYGDLANKREKLNTQTNICENQYDECHYDDRLSKKEIYYEVPENIEDMVVDEPHYTEIDYSRCKPRIIEPPVRTSYVYDEPYL